MSIDLDENNSFEYKIIDFAKDILKFDESDEFQQNLIRRNSYVANDEVVERNADILAEDTYNRYYKSYYQSIVSNGIKSVFLRYLGKLVGKDFINLNETMLLHNIQIESHRWCVERYLYNMNCKENAFLNKDE